MARIFFFEKKRATMARFSRAHVLILLRSPIYVSLHHSALTYIDTQVRLAGLCSEAARYMARIFLCSFFVFRFVFFFYAQEQYPSRQRGGVEIFVPCWCDFFFF